MSRNFFISTLLLTVLLFSACTKERVEDCSAVLKLHFNFALHTREGNRFGEDVRVVRVYCFDSQGILRHIQQESGDLLTNDYTMAIKLPPGEYTVLAWGGGEHNLFSSYHEAEMIDPVTHNYKHAVVVGKTALSDLYTILNYDLTGDPEVITPKRAAHGDLFYGAIGERNPSSSVYTVEQLDLKPLITVERTLELIRNTNILNITISGIQNLDPAPVVTPVLDGAPMLNFKLSAAGRNGEYLFSNAFCPYARIVRYIPWTATVANDQIVAAIKIQRLDMQRHVSDPVFLTFEAPNGRLFPEKPIDIVNTLLQARNPDTGEYIYNSQSDFDRIYEHPIELRIGADLKVAIFIGEWEIVDVIPIP